MLKSLLTHNIEMILNDAIREELYASQLYRHLSAQCQRLGLFGASKYFKGESADELEHYQKHVDYINDRGSVADCPAIEACEQSITDLASALEAAYFAETSLGDKYSEWYKAALVFDPVTANYLLQFLSIQQKSIGEYGDWLARLKLVEDDACGMLMIDKEFGG